MKTLALLLLATAAFAQPKERAAVKTLSDGFQPDLTHVQKVTVRSIEALPLVKVGHETPRMKSEEQVLQITGTIQRIKLEADGDVHAEVTDDTMDSTVVCEVVDPLYSTKSVMLTKLEAARLAAKRLEVGDKVTFVGLRFQDVFHSPSPHRTRNFIELHPVLGVKK